MKELHDDLGLSRAELREALAGGLAKLRLNLWAPKPLYDPRLGPSTRPIAELNVEVDQ